MKLTPRAILLRVTLPVLLGAVALPAAAQEATPATATSPAPAPAPAPARHNPDPNKPVTLAEAKAKEQEQAIADTAGLPSITAKRIEDIVKLSIKDKQLKLDTSVTTTEESSVRVPGLPGVSKVRRMNTTEPGRTETAMIQFNFENRDYTIPHAIAQYTSVSFAAGQLTVAQAWETVDENVYHVQLIQNARARAQAADAEGDPDPLVTLYVQQTGTPEVNFRLTADNVVELRRKHPAEVSKYVDPMFRALRQEGLLARVDPRLAWQVFADAYAPEAPVVARVGELVKQLGAAEFPQREAASRQLAQLGQPAALVLMRQDRKGLSEEQVSQIDAFVATFRTVSDAEADRLRQDRDFLLDCLYADEEPIRARALAELRKVTGKQVQFEVAADPEQRLAAIAKLREEVGAPPATQRSRR